jgi:hypothetical protein
MRVLKQMPKRKLVVNALSAVAALAAAVLWIWPANARVPTDLVPGIQHDGG